VAKLAEVAGHDDQAAAACMARGVTVEREHFESCGEALDFAPVVLLVGPRIIDAGVALASRGFKWWYPHQERGGT
jgi:hypothetical protein